MKILTSLLSVAILFLALSFEVLAQSTTIDGWTVSYLGRTVNNGNTTFTYRACYQAGQGPLKTFTIGLPECFPEFTAVASSPAKPLTPRRDPQSGVVGVLFDGLNIASGCQNFSATLEGEFTDAQIDQIFIGLTDQDSGGACPQCGEGRTLPGPKCINGQFVEGTKVCNAKYSPYDVVIMQDASRCTVPWDKYDDPRRDAQLDAALGFVDDMDALDRGARIAIASYSWGASQACNTQSYPGNVDAPWARFLSLEDGNNGFDYDGFIHTHPEYAPHTYRAIETGIAYSCGDSPLDAAINSAHGHINTPWGDNKTKNVIILISTGRPNRWYANGGGVCTGASASNCTTAKNFAAASAAKAKSEGSEIFTIFLDDDTCGCLTTDVAAGKAFLKDHIATDSQHYYEATVDNIYDVIKLIKHKLVKNAVCDPGDTCRDGCCISDKPTPTPTPTPTKTPTSNISCTIGNGTISTFNINCNAGSLTVPLGATVSGTTGTVVKQWTSNCPNSQVITTGNNSVSLTFTPNGQTSTQCDVTLQIANGSSTNSCALKLNAIPTCGPNCTNINAQSVQLAIDTNAAAINKLAVSAGKLLTSIAKTKPKALKKKLNAKAAANINSAAAANTALWVTAWTKLNPFFTSCTNATNCAQVAFTAQKTILQSSQNQLVKAVSNLLTSITKNTRDKRNLNRAKSIRKQLNNLAREELKAINQIPASSQVCS